jgi:uncharacterized protein (UPF0276 family)
MPQIYSSIACNLDAGILSAALPLFEAEKIQAIEWSFDTLFKYEKIPDWFCELIKTFADQGRLVGHGVFFSLFSGKWSPAQQHWLERLKMLSEEFQFDHITEHFGFMTGEDFHKGAPISIPFTPSTLAIGRDRLLRIQEACRCPVGLENLAFAYTLDEVRKHGYFLEKLIEPVNGFIILDLHNLYCQIQNFNIAYEKILDIYPLEKVREIHISGGSWVENDKMESGWVRRDTHDDAVPNAVFELLKNTVPRCPNLKFIVLEQLGTGLETEQSQMQFRRDFSKMDLIVKAANRFRNNEPLYTFLPERIAHKLSSPVQDLHLYEQQICLSKILETAADYGQARQFLSETTLANSDWEVEKWEPAMLETALAIAQKWKNGFYGGEKNN